ncbi:MAG: hypothetical protein EGQ10_00535, partial [Clostridiales bacterium]|nr:hypothetical protein [Clostridiales bacterium]
MKTLKEFDYDLWAIEENGRKRYFARIKATGEETEVSLEVMRLLLRQEKQIRREYAKQQTIGPVLSLDAIRDGGAGEKLKGRSVALALRRSYRAAAQRRPDFDRVVKTCLDELHQLEEANTPSLDRPADAFARLLQAAAIAVSPAARQSAVAQILYHVGRWIYLADAWDDLAEDREAGNYNPL